MPAERAQRGVGLQGHVRFSNCRVPTAPPARSRTARDTTRAAAPPTVGWPFSSWGTDRRVLLVLGTLGQQLFYVRTEFLSLPTPKAQVHVTNDAVAVDQVG